MHLHPRASALICFGVFLLAGCGLVAPLDEHAGEVAGPTTYVVPGDGETRSEPTSDRDAGSEGSEASVRLDSAPEAAPVKDAAIGPICVRADAGSTPCPEDAPLFHECDEPLPRGFAGCVDAGRRGAAYLYCC